MSRRNSRHLIPIYIYQQKLSAILMACITLLLTVALATYNPTDASWFYTTNASVPINNLAGQWGANSAALLLYLFGASCWWLLVACYLLTASLWRYSNWYHQWDRIVACLLLMLTGSAFAAYYKVDFLGAPFPGGYVGGALIQGLERIADTMVISWGLSACLAVGLIIVLR